MTSSISRRAVLYTTVAFGTALHSRPARAAYEARVAVDASAPGRPVNRAVLGSNVQWVDRGDEMIDGARHPKPSMDEAARQIGPTVLRYPGGSLSDIYPWRNGVGQSRGTGTHFFSGATQTIEFGTDEFLDLCARLDARPLITVNVATGTPEDAADWVRYVTKAAQQRGIPAADWWEIGNEPYLREEKQRAIALGPDEYVRRADPIIAAMRGAASGLKLGIPLRADQIGGLPATPFPGFNEKVLRGLREKFDFVSTHEAYAPFAVDRSYADKDLYLALMAAPEQIAEGIAATRAQVSARLGRTLPIAVTEWSAFFSLGGRSDGQIATAAGALFAADLLRVFVQHSDVMTANHWSLSGNWYFGALAQDGRPRPVAILLAAFGTALRGNLIPASVDTPTFSTPRVGYVAARSAVPQLTALAVRDERRLTLSLVNRSPVASANVRVTCGADSPREASAQVLAPTSPFATTVAWERRSVALDDATVSLEMPPHAVALLQIALASP